MALNKTVEAVTKRIIERSLKSRRDYMDRMDHMRKTYPNRAHLSCGNIAHVAAACSASDKEKIAGERAANLAIITAYNDMLSAHQPFEKYPDLIREAAHKKGASVQVAGGVPAMCDGVTQGQPGMELSLFSRDIIAMSAAVGLSHNCFDAVIYLGVCDKIIPGLVMAAATFGHLPSIFLPAGPMPSGLENDEKARIRKLYAKGEIDRAELLKAEMSSYHSPGTCTFYGTANTNQFLMEMMGLHLPASAFVNPNTDLRSALTKVGAERAIDIALNTASPIPVCDILDERAFVNAIVGLHATGGSTNLVIHLCAMARAAGVIIDLEDLADLSTVTPLLARVYPNGMADVNHFHAAGGSGLIISQLLNAGLLHADVQTVMGKGLERYTQEPYLDDQGHVFWKEGTDKSLDEQVIRTTTNPFAPQGGLANLRGNLGNAIMKISAVSEDRHIIEAPVALFHDQHDVKAAFEKGELNRDVVVVVRFQGPKANGMPELHSLTPVLSVLQDKGFKVALLTDGRMSGASGKVPAAIHLSPEAEAGGPIARLQEGDIVRLDATTGALDVLVDDTEFNSRALATCDLTASHTGLGRELFAAFRQVVTSADQGASVTLTTHDLG